MPSLTEAYARDVAKLRDILLISILMLCVFLTITQVFLPTDPLNIDTYYHYSVASAYLASIDNIAQLGTNTIGPIIPAVIAALRLFIDPGNDLHAMEVFARVLAAVFIGLTWAGSVLVLRSAKQDWSALTAFSALFFLTIDWGTLDYRSLNGELFSAPLLIALLLCAPSANPRNFRGLVHLCISALLLPIVFFTKLQAFPIACFVFVFADALRDAFTPRAAFWRTALVIAASAILAILPALFGLHAQDVVTNALSYLHGSGYVTPPDRTITLIRDFLHQFRIAAVGFWVTLALTITSVCLLNAPAGRNIRLGLTQAEWFTLGLLVTTIICIILPLRFFLHYSLLLLPTLPLIFSIFMTRCSNLNSNRWTQVAVLGLCAFAVLYQWRFIKYGQWASFLSPSSEIVQRNAELIRVACPNVRFPIVVHGWDYRYYIALGSYAPIPLLDTARQAGFPVKLVDAYRQELRKGSSLIIDIVDPNSVLDHDFPNLDGLLGSDAAKYRRIAVAPMVAVYCPKSGA